MAGDVAPGFQIGPFVLEEVIGRGGFATVWRGRHAGTAERVAVKIIGSESIAVEKLIPRAEIELLAATAARRSPHAVEVLGGGLEPVPHVVMEFVDGTDFAHILRAEGRLSVERAVGAGLAICDALRAMHGAGIIHRDLKPGNVMLTKDGVVKVTDFGIAKIVGYETVTLDGEAVLTMAYAAPEVWDSDGPFGAPSERSDLYALGIMLYEFLCGSPPFRGNYSAMFLSHREAQPDLSSLPEETPASLRTLITACLRKQPADRPGSAADCLPLLRRSLVELREARDGLPPTEPARFGPWQRLRPHPRQPWSWICRRAGSEVEACVEVLFAPDAATGARLRLAVAANPALVPLGAEELLETNRLLLRPGEAWEEAPTGDFQFWIARREQAPEPGTGVISTTVLRGIAASLSRLIDAATSRGVALRFDPTDTVILEDGSVHLRRPGISAAKTTMDDAAWAFLEQLPLDARARALLEESGDLRALATTARQGPPDPTVLRSGLHCPRCSSAVEAGDSFCGNCGQRISVSPGCPGCGAEVEPGDMFCGNCGRRLG